MKEQLGTRIEPSVGHRLRVYAALSDQKIGAVVNAALDRYLPSLVDLVRQPGSEVGQAGGRRVQAAGGGR